MPSTLEDPPSHNGTARLPQSNIRKRPASSSSGHNDSTDFMETNRDGDDVNDEVQDGRPRQIPRFDTAPEPSVSGSLATLRRGIGRAMELVDPTLFINRAFVIEPKAWLPREAKRYRTMIADHGGSLISPENIHGTVPAPSVLIPSPAQESPTYSGTGARLAHGIGPSYSRYFGLERTSSAWLDKCLSSGHTDHKPDWFGLVGKVPHRTKPGHTELDHMGKAVEAEYVRAHSYLLSMDRYFDKGSRSREAFYKYQDQEDEKKGIDRGRGQPKGQRSKAKSFCILYRYVFEDCCPRFKELSKTTKKDFPCLAATGPIGNSSPAELPSSGRYSPGRLEELELVATLAGMSRHRDYHSVLPTPSPSIRTDSAAPTPTPSIVDHIKLEHNVGPATPDSAMSPPLREYWRDADDDGSTPTLGAQEIYLDHSTPTQQTFALSPDSSIDGQDDDREDASSRQGTAAVDSTDSISSNAGTELFDGLLPISAPDPSGSGETHQMARDDGRQASDMPAAAFNTGVSAEALQELGDRLAAKLDECANLPPSVKTGLKAYRRIIEVASSPLITDASAISSLLDHLGSLLSLRNSHRDSTRSLIYAPVNCLHRYSDLRYFKMPANKRKDHDGALRVAMGGQGRIMPDSKTTLFTPNLKTGRLSLVHINLSIRHAVIYQDKLDANRFGELRDSIERLLRDICDTADLEVDKQPPLISLPGQGDDSEEQSKHGWTAVCRLISIMEDLCGWPKHCELSIEQDSPLSTGKTEVRQTSPPPSSSSSSPNPSPASLTDQLVPVNTLAPIDRCLHPTLCAMRILSRIRSLSVSPTSTATDSLDHPRVQPAG